MEWADAAVWRAAAGLDAAGPPDPALLKWLLHIHTVQRAFLHIWTGRAMAFPAVETFPTLASLRDWARGYYPDAHAWIEGAEEARLAEPLALPWAREIAERIGRSAGPATVGDTCFQVTSHSTYHRGQVNRRLRELGAEPPLVDYIAWVWFGKPKAEW